MYAHCTVKNTKPIQIAIIFYYYFIDIQLSFQLNQILTEKYQSTKKHVHISQI